MRLMPIDPNLNIVKTNLVYWMDARFQTCYSGSGTTVNDLSGTGYTGTLQNGTAFETGNGNVFDFDGTNDVINLGNNNIVTAGSHFSLEAWAYAERYQNFDGIISRVTSTSPFGGYQLNVSTQSSIAGFDFALNRSGTWTTWSVAGNWHPSSLSTNTWYHVVGTYDNSTIRMYINGAEVGSGRSVSGSLQYRSGIGDTFIGRNGAGTHFQGKIGQARIYEKALSAAEVLHNYNQTKVRFGL